MYHRTQHGKLIISKTGDKYTTYHKLNTIYINGNSNELNIRHKILKLIINGNNNIIEINSSGNIQLIILKGNNNKIMTNIPLNISDFGRGNKEIFNRNNLDEEDDDSDELVEQPQRYVLDWEKEEIDEDEEESDDNNQREINELRYNINILIQSTNLFINSIAQLILNNILSNLIDISFKKNEINKDNEKCAICYEYFIENETIKMTHCFHLYHFFCIKKWIETKIDSPDCPICRRKF